MSEWKVITDAARAVLRIGESWGTTTHEITDLWLREYAVTLNDANPLWFDDAYAKRYGRFGFRFCPAAFCAVLNPAERAEIMPQMAFFGRLRGMPEGQGTWGFAAYTNADYRRPIRVGDRVTCTVRVDGVKEKELKTGEVLVLVDIVYGMTDADGEEIGTVTAGVAHKFTPGPSAARKAAP